MVGAVTSRPARPDTLLLGRFDRTGTLRPVARTAPLPEALAADLARALTPAASGHPWHGLRVRARWGSREPLHFTPVEPTAVVEFSGDTAVDAGRWRHPVRALRLRADITATDVPDAAAGYTPAAG
ncbi:hypothetical protein [Streptomyces capparidis]